MKKAEIHNRYGYNNEKTGEYVITRPDTPTPWMNYLGQGVWRHHFEQCRGLLF